MGIVTARDFTNDPAHGINTEELAEALRAAKDERIKYIISNRKIASGTGQEHTAWQWRPYPVPPNKNPHDHHVHISVKSDKEHYDSILPWVIALSPSAALVAAAPVVSDPVLRKGATGSDVVRLQNLLKVRGETLDANSDFDDETEAAVEHFQEANGLVVDGVVGKYTWEALQTG
jgi:hypothetical protein